MQGQDPEDYILVPLPGEDGNIPYSDFELTDPDEDDLHPGPEDMQGGGQEDRPADDPAGQARAHMCARRQV